MRLKREFTYFWFIWTLNSLSPSEELIQKGVFLFRTEEPFVTAQWSCWPIAHNLDQLQNRKFRGLELGYSLKKFCCLYFATCNFLSAVSKRIREVVWVATRAALRFRFCDHFSWTKKNWKVQIANQSGSQLNVSSCVPLKVHPPFSETEIQTLDFANLDEP